MVADVPSVPDVSASITSMFNAYRDQQVFQGLRDHVIFTIFDLFKHAPYHEELIRKEIRSQSPKDIFPMA